MAVRRWLKVFATSPISKAHRHIMMSDRISLGRSSNACVEIMDERTTVEVAVQGMSAFAGRGDCNESHQKSEYAQYSGYSESSGRYERQHTSKETS
jgi:hypothetical protein